jgi:hypothetical protein
MKTPQRKYLFIFRRRLFPDPRVRREAKTEVMCLPVPRFVEPVTRYVPSIDPRIRKTYETPTADLSVPFFESVEYEFAKERYPLDILKQALHVSGIFEL